MADYHPTRKNDNRRTPAILLQSACTAALVMLLVFGCGGSPAGPGEQPPAAPATETAAPAAEAPAPEQTPAAEPVK